MRKYLFIVKLTNKVYEKSAFNKEQAIILAQAEAIQEGRPYELISVSKQ